MYKKEEGGRKERTVKVRKTEKKRGYQSINQSAHLESEAKKERKNTTHFVRSRTAYTCRSQIFTVGSYLPTLQKTKQREALS